MGHQRMEVENVLRKTLSAEEADQLWRSVKKYKIQYEEDSRRDGHDTYLQDTVANACPEYSYTDVLRQGSQTMRLFYTVVGEVEEENDDRDCFQNMEHVNGEPSRKLNVAWPSIDITVEECRQLSILWHRALVIKLLGKAVSLKM